MLQSILRGGVIVSAAFALIALMILIVRTFSFGKKPYHSQPAGKPLNGVIYAFGRGMMPWEKESAGKHLPTFAAGIIYHLAIFAALLYLITSLLEMAIPATVLLALRVILLAGLLCGFALLLKRIIIPYMRGISCFDDFVANMFVNLFLGAALAVTLATGLKSLFFIMAITLFIYIPMGKIRHCFYFFYTRAFFGIFFGRRGVFPHPSREV
ncbi:MAG: hypothetical protein NT002_12415 [candidate division Zixibacteria bacterium]|nr:hypothetical protein [candidate division Zixibacteria bacterium]